MSSAAVDVLRPGYCRRQAPAVVCADGSTTLLCDAGQRILVDTLGPWSRDDLLALLQQRGLRSSDVDVVVCTHTHPDHAGNLNLFTDSRLHVCGFSVYREDRYETHAFDAGEPLQLTPRISVIPTPGHTLTCVSVVVRDAEGLGTVVVAGDLFERREDLTDESIWIEAGSEDVDKQRRSRASVLQLADYIVPGHGPMFRVPR